MLGARAPVRGNGAGKRPKVVAAHVAPSHADKDEDEDEDEMPRSPATNAHFDIVDETVMHTGRTDDDVTEGTRDRNGMDKAVFTTKSDCGLFYHWARRAADDAFLVGAKTVARPYQSDGVAKLISLIWLDQLAAQTRPINYLVQHAAGTGKSLTIAVLALTLLNLKHDAVTTPAGQRKSDSKVGGGVDVKGSDDGGSGLFSTVLIITDRLQLDRQLGDTGQS